MILLAFTTLLLRSLAPKVTITVPSPISDTFSTTRLPVTSPSVSSVAVTPESSSASVIPFRYSICISSIWITGAVRSSSRYSTTLSAIRITSRVQSIITIFLIITSWAVRPCRFCLRRFPQRPFLSPQSSAVPLPLSPVRTQHLSPDHPPGSLRPASQSPSHPHPEA